MPTIGYLMRVGETVCPGSGDWVVTPVAVSIGCADRHGNIEGEVHQRWDEARPAASWAIWIASSAYARLN